MKLLQAIWDGLPLDDIVDIFEKETDFDKCLCVAIEKRMPQWFLDKLFDKTEDFDGCLFFAIWKNMDKEFIEKLFEKTTNFGGCLCYALWKPYPREFLDRLFERTTNFDDCLKTAIVQGILDPNIVTQDLLDSLFEKTTDFKMCLFWAITTKRPQKFLDRLFKETTNFDHCLGAAIKSGMFEGKFVDDLFEKTEDFIGCMHAALVHGNAPIELLYRLLKRTDHNYWCVEEAIRQNAADIARGNKPRIPEEFINDLFIKNVRNTTEENVDIESLPKIFGSVRDTTGWLSYAIWNNFPQPLIEEILKKTSRPHGNLFIAAVKGMPEEFLELLLERCGKSDHVVEGYEKYCCEFAKKDKCCTDFKRDCCDAGHHINL